ncbi:MAG: hypothetical protein N3A61_04205 [Ignavibacteria bacterium]|nr:hypothetical protein [Ignavibacteria bacterium]
MKEKHLEEIEIARTSEFLLQNNFNELSEEIKFHLNECKECRLEVFSLFSLLKGYHRENISRTSENFWSKNKVYLRYAAVFLSLIGGALIYYSLIMKQPSSRLNKDIEKLQGKDVITKHESTNYSENLIPSKNLENLIGQAVRSEIYAEIISPQINQTVESNEFKFQWKTNYKGKLSIVILNNKDSVIKSYQTNFDSITIKFDFPPGLYYWKIETPEELLSIGKFFYSKKLN